MYVYTPKYALKQCLFALYGPQMYQVGSYKGRGKIGPQNENKCLIRNIPVLTPQKKRKRKEENEEKVRRKPKKESNIKKEV